MTAVEAGRSALLAPAEVERIIREGLPMAGRAGLCVESITPQHARVRLKYHDWMLRPGGSIAGPILMTAADTAMYAVILAHTGGETMALTSDLSIRFLARSQPGDVIAEARLLKLGRRLAVVEVLIRIEGCNTPVAHATGSYVRPVGPTER